MAHMPITPDLVANRPLLETIRGALVFKNPVYEQTLRRRGMPPARVDPEIRTYIYNRETGVLSVPRGFVEQLYSLLQGQGYNPTVIDRTALPHIVDCYQTNYQLRPYQVPAVNALLGYSNGTLIAPCGSGKTTMGLHLIASLRRPALWVTHTKRLAKQTEERARSLLGLTEIGMIGDGQFDISPGLTIAMVQTMVRRDLEALANRWGTIIYDEAHHIPAVSFARVANALSARYRYGLTANTARADGLYPVVLRLIGPIRHEITQAEVERSGGTMTPDLVRVETGRRYRDKDEDENDYDFAGLMVKETARDQVRSEVIAGTVARQPADSRTLILVQLVEHADTLAEMLRDYYGISAAAFHGGLTGKRTEQVDREFRDGRLTTLVATLGLAKEGLDYPWLTDLHLAAPMRDPEGVKQAVGRVMRSHPGKTRATVYDYVDVGPDLLINQARDRMRVFRKLGLRLDGRRL